MRLQGILLFLVHVSDHLQQFFCIIYAKMHEKLTFFPSKNIFCPLLWESSFQKVPYSSRNLLYKKLVSPLLLCIKVPYCERVPYSSSFYIFALSACILQAKCIWCVIARQAVLDVLLTCKIDSNFGLFVGCLVFFLPHNHSQAFAKHLK